MTRKDIVTIIDLLAQPLALVATALLWMRINSVVIAPRVADWMASDMNGAPMQLWPQGAAVIASHVVLFSLLYVCVIFCAQVVLARLSLAGEVR